MKVAFDWLIQGAWCATTNDTSFESPEMWLHPAARCSQMDHGLSLQDIFFSKYHLFLEGSVGTANIHYPAAMRSITLPCTVEILLQKPAIYNPFFFLLFQTEDQADWNHVIWGPLITQFISFQMLMKIAKKEWRKKLQI